MSAGRLTPGREYALALALLVLGGALGLLSAGRVWATAVDDGGLGPQVYAATGRDLAPLGAAGALVALAGVVAVPATRRLGRAVVGAVLALVGLGQIASVPLATGLPGWGPVAAGAGGLGSPSGPMAAFVASATGRTEAYPSQVAASAWPVVLAAGGLAVLAAGVLVTVRGLRWPALGRTYEPPAVDGAAPGSGLWQVLDRGEDPTA